MEKIALADVDSRVSPAAVFRPLSEPLGTDGVALNYFELAPGDAFGYCYHRHREQEEVFYVQSGTATFETEAGDVAVGPGELIRFAPGEYQRGSNRDDERVVALALGAPREQGPTDLLRECPECGERTPASIELADDGAESGETVRALCLDCGAETGRFTV